MKMSGVERHQLRHHHSRFDVVVYSSSVLSVVVDVRRVSVIVR